MKEHKPVALWKGIVGTALSGMIIMVCLPFFIFFAYVNGEKEYWLIITLAVAILVCMFSLILSVSNLITTVNYKRNANIDSSIISIKEETVDTSNDDEKTELLHKLLSEGKITIEEYDQLRNK